MVSEVLKADIALIKDLSSDARETVVSAIAIAILIEDLKLESQMEASDFEILARSFYVSPDVKNKTCPSYDAVFANFPDFRRLVLFLVCAVFYFFFI